MKHYRLYNTKRRNGVRISKLAVVIKKIEDMYYSEGKEYITDDELEGIFGAAIIEKEKE